MPETHRDGVLRSLQGALEALAWPADRQMALFPELLVPGGELAREFDNWYSVLIRSRYDRDLPEGARESLYELDHALDEMVDAREHLFSAQGVAESVEWARIRVVAAEALRAIDWPEGEAGGPPGEET